MADPEYTAEEAADEIERLRSIFRVNILRLAPETPHAEIDVKVRGAPQARPSGAKRNDV